MKIHTESGSVWEIEPTASGYRVRRLISGAPSPSNVRASEQWRDAVEVTQPVIGRPILINWQYRDNVLESTMTSIVTAVITEPAN